MPAGNSSTALITSIAHDTVAPTVVVSDNLAGTANIATGAIAYTLQFSEAVSTLEASIANRVEARQRPRSSMSPTFVFDAGGRHVMIVGSPGGHAIIHYVARVIVAVLDWGMPLQAALDAPHFGSRNGPTDLEANTPVARLQPQLEALGHPVRVLELASGVHAIFRVGDSWVGAADPRRDGTARGK